MLKKDAHRGVVAITPILLLEPEIGRIEMYDKGGGFATIFAQDVGRSYDCSIISRYILSTVADSKRAMCTNHMALVSVMPVAVEGQVRLL